MPDGFCICIPKEWGPWGKSLELAAETGWDGYFTVWKPEDEGELAALAKKAGEIGMAVQSVHAQRGRAADMWGEDESRGRSPN